VRLRKLAIDGEKTLQGTCVSAELPSVVLSAFEHRLDRPNLSLVHRRPGVGPPTVGIPRAESHRAGIPSALHRRGAAP
jgi:hypothetical protein